MENNEDKKKKKKELNFETFAVDSSGTLVPKEKTPTPFRTKIKENQLENQHFQQEQKPTTHSNTFMTNKIKDFEEELEQNRQQQPSEKKSDELKITNAFLVEELDFLEEEGIVASDLSSKWSWLSEDLAKKYFRSVLLPFFMLKPKLTNAELVKLGFKPFIQKLKRMEDINFSKIKNFYIHRKKFNLIKWYVRLYGREQLDKKLANAESRLKLLQENGGAISHSSLRNSKIKLKLFFDLGFVPVKCKECDVDIVFFTALQLHHPTEKKSITLQDLYDNLYTYEEGLKKFKIDGVEILCSNHHLKKLHFFLNTFADLIFKKDLFSLSAEDIDIYISNYLSRFSRTDDYKKIVHKKYTSKKKEIPKKILIKWKWAIKTWMRKRYVFSVLFDGKCLICGSSELSSLELHHINPELKNIIKKWGSVAKFDCEKIIRLIIEEKCISLCSNCHSFITYKFHISVRKVLNGFYSESEIDAIAKKVLAFYNKSVRVISSFKHDLKKIDYRSPLKLEFSQNDIWKIYLIAMYFYLKKKGENYFFHRDFSNDTTFSITAALNLSKRTRFLKTKKVTTKINPEYGNLSQRANLFFITAVGGDRVISLIKQHPKATIEVENFIIRRLNGENINYKDLYKLLKINITELVREEDEDIRKDEDITKYW